MPAPGLTTNVVVMTMNWYVAESLISDRTAGQVRAENRRWPELDHARRLQAAREIGREYTRRVGRTPTPPTAASPAHRLANLFRGLVAGHPVAQR
jgi:hypothetical protein